MPLDRAALIGCGVTTGLGAVLNTAKVEPGSMVAVFGAGGVGLSAIQGALITGARRVIAVDIGEFKLSKARELGATDVVDAGKGDPVATIRDMTGGGVDYSFEAIGKNETSLQAFNALRVGGICTLIGGGGVTVDPMHLMLGERQLRGCIMGSSRFRVDMPRYIEFYRQGRLKLDEMISRHGPLEDINKAFQAMCDRSVARTVLIFPT